MSRFWDNTPEIEASAGLVFSGNPLDRQSENRSEDCVQSALADPATRVIGFVKGRVAIELKDGEGEALLPPAAFDGLSAKKKFAALLGFDEDGPVVAMPLGFDPEDEVSPLAKNMKAIDYRSLAIQGLISDQALGLVAQGGSLLAWNASHRFCSRCGARSEMKAGGYKRICPNCKAEHFPRTDPVVIMLTIDGDRCLMGRGHNFPPGMYSALAGFVEPGETIEDAVRRETLEESGIRIGRVKYFATQPWPFPHTLMIGCYGEALSTEIDTYIEELAECRWFTRDELKAVIDGKGETNDDGTPKIFVPPKMAIAHHLMKNWVYAE